MTTIIADWEAPSVWGLLAGLASLTVVLGFLWRVYRGILQWRDAQVATNRKVDKMWSYLMRRGWVEARVSGIVEPYGQHGRETVRDDVREVFASRIGEMRAWYRGAWRIQPSLQSDDDELKFEIESQFGDWIAKNVCLPLSIKSGECLQAAMVLTREDHSEHVRRYDLLEPS